MPPATAAGLPKGIRPSIATVLVEITPQTADACRNEPGSDDDATRPRRHGKIATSGTSRYLPAGLVKTPPSGSDLSNGIGKPGIETPPGT